MSAVSHSAPAPEQSQAALVVPVANISTRSPTTLELVELLLKDPGRLNVLVRVRSYQAEMIPRFLALALVGFTVFGVALSLVFGGAQIWPEFHSIAGYFDGRQSSLFEYVRTGAAFLQPWIDGSAWKLLIVYNFGMIAAVGICLPSFYFYGLLAGVKLSMLDVVVHAMKGQATTAVALVGIVPIYAALVLGALVFDAPQSWLSPLLNLGLILPFVAGFVGMWSLYTGFLTLADTLPEDRCRRRECFLRRLLVSWSVCYTVVTPIMLHTVWQHLS